MLKLWLSAYLATNDGRHFFGESGKCSKVVRVIRHNEMVGDQPDAWHACRQNTQLAETVIRNMHRG